MKQFIRFVLHRLGWQLVRHRPVSHPAGDLHSFFLVLKRLGFSPKHIIDVGANHGNWTRAAIEFFPEASFTLVEPQDYLKADIQDLISRGSKLKWINAGAGDKPGNLLFTIGDRDDSGTFLASSQKVPEADRQQVSVSVRTLNEIVASGDAPPPEMVKIDAEGFDLKVLDGADDLLGKTEIFLIEAAVCAPGLENTTQEIMHRMVEAGYQLFDVTDLNRSPKSGVLWICELAFIKTDSPLLAGLTSYA